MFSIRSILATSITVALIAPTLAHADQSQDEQAIRQTIARYESALNASDTTRIVDLYTENGIQMAPDAPTAVGAQALRQTYDKTFKAISLALKFTVDEVKLLGKNTALLRSHSEGTLKVNSADSAANPAAFKELFILAKQPDGDWKLSHYSFASAPLGHP